MDFCIGFRFYVSYMNTALVYMPWIFHLSTYSMDITTAQLVSIEVRSFPGDFEHRGC